MSTGSLNPVSVAELIGAVVGLLAAAAAWPLGRVREWEDLRPLPWLALSAAAVAGASLPGTLELPPTVYPWAGRVLVAATALYVLVWLVYLPGWARRPPLSWRRAWPLAAVAALALVPGAVLGGGTWARPLPWLGVTEHLPVVTRSGVALCLVLGGYAAWGMVLLLRWGRAGAPQARVHAACAGFVLALGLHDGAVACGLPSPAPSLLGLLCVVPVSIFGVVTLCRVSENASQVQALRASLEAAVEDRTRRLEESRTALARAERLAALGQFSAGVAHEVNNPAAAVAANLQYLASELSGDGREEVQRCIEDARAGVQRIAALTRQLLLAGRTAGGAGRAPSPVSLSQVVEPAVASARARAEHGVALEVDLPPGLWVRANQEPLVQVLSNLLVNAVQAIPPDRTGKVAVRAGQSGDRVQLAIEDDGVGMSEEELRHVFEPFYSTKPPGMGTGLGLAVARSLVAAMKGELRFESAPGRGTRAVLELQAASPGEPGVASGPAVTPPPAPRSSILIIDDDEQVLRSMARLLGRKHDVRVAAGVQEGLAALEASAPELVLCDVMMPGGGGERFWAELLLKAPTLIDRVVFMTGGAATREARAFLRRHPGPVLSKPFDLTAVDALLGRSAGEGAGTPSAGGPPAPAGLAT